MDVTTPKLIGGTKPYVHAVIDNFSHRILDWAAVDHLDPMNTHDVLDPSAARRAQP